MEQLWPGLLAEAWTALAADNGDQNPKAPHYPDDRLWLPAGLEVLWISGAPGYLPSRLPVEDVAIACTGAALLAAAALHSQRGGDCGSRGWPTARLDRGHVAAAFRSEGYLRINGEQAGPGFAPLSRFWRAADGWVRTHGNYPWHRSALLRALGCSGDPEAVAAAIAALDARQVEDLVIGAGGVAAAVRGADGWRAEPPGQAAAATKLVEETSIGGAPPRVRGWYRNLEGNPHFTLHLKGAVKADLSATARPITDPQERRDVFGRIIDSLHSPSVSLDFELPPVEEWVKSSPLVEVTFDDFAA